ncbi:MAG TPA: DUF2339 domain-containing protein [Terracidiphilus sp.]
MEPKPPGTLEEQVAFLTSRVYRLEETLRQHGLLDQAIPDQGPAQAVATAAAPVETPPPTAPIPVEAPTPIVAAPEPPAAERPWIDVVSASASSAPPPPTFGAYTQPAPAFSSITSEQRQSLENRIGSQWFNRIGILAVLIGMAWFLKFAIDNQWIGPLGRILIGLVASGALIAWSERFRAKGFPVFSYSLKAVGSGVLYLSLWAAFSIYHLLPAGAAFAAMVIVTAFNGFMAWRQNSELLALYAIAGGISTPVLLSTGENHELALFAYVLLLDVSVLVLTILRPWSRLLFGAFTGTLIMIAGWWLTYYTHDQFGLTLFFVTCFFVLFAAAPRLVRIGLETDAKPSAWDSLALVVQPVLNASLAFVAYLALFDRPTTRGASPWIAVAFAAFYLLLLRLPARSLWRPSTNLTASLHLAAAVVFLTLAIPLKTQGHWLTVGWLSEGAALVWVARKLHSRLLGAMALGSLGLGLIALFTIYPPVSTTPIFNARFGTYCFAIAVFAFLAWLISRPTDAQQATPTEEADEPASNSLTSGLPIAVSLFLVNLLIFIAGLTEIHACWTTVLYDTFGLGSASSYEWLSHAAFLVLFGSALLTLAIPRRSAFLRWQAIVVLAFGILTLFSSSELSGLTPLLNAHFAVYCLAIAAFAFLGWRLKQAAPQESDWRMLAIACGLLVNILILVGVTTEIHAYWSSLVYQVHGYATGSVYEQFSYSAFFMLFGSVLLAVGFMRRSAFLRWQALILIAVSIAKVFLVDMSALSQGYRILSFLGLGVLLLAVSFAYQRDWLNLRGSQKDSE